MSEEHNLTQVVRDFYNDCSEKLPFICEVNDHQLVKMHNDIIVQIHEETMKRYYGSGYLIPEKVEGSKIVDLGCGSGSLVYILSKLVGRQGHVTGVDITPNLILECKKYSSYHTEKWGYSEANFEFRQANIERFDDIGVKEKTADVVVSNGVLCLCPNKRDVFDNAYRLLKDGGEFCLSDVYADRDRPKDKLDDPQLFSLGTTGSMRWDEMKSVPSAAGFTKPYLTGAGPVAFANQEIHDSVGNAEFVCAEWRLFRLPPGARRSAAEVTYNGNIAGCEDVFRWDVNTVFRKGEAVLVDSDLASILAFSRFKDSFTFKDSNSSVVSPQLQDPYAYLDELRKQGKTVTPVYKV